MLLNKDWSNKSTPLHETTLRHLIITYSKDRSLFPIIEKIKNETNY